MCYQVWLHALRAVPLPFLRPRSFIRLYDLRDLFESDGRASSLSTTINASCVARLRSIYNRPILSILLHIGSTCISSFFRTSQYPYMRRKWRTSHNNRSLCQHHPYMLNPCRHIQLQTYIAAHTHLLADAIGRALLDSSAPRASYYPCPRRRAPASRPLRL